MKLQLLERDIERKEQTLHNLESSLVYFKQEGEKHKEDINLVAYELFYIKDQLDKYKTLVNLLDEEESQDEMPKKI